uniref:Peptide deformylase n=1 Tax=uncultured Alphaproteobacteria bacterium TaxID=91750 RepID=A0A6G8F202_9PROT|nr:peptide deformylase [uncultured Alphaproteobacteria bacterium]
MAKLKIYEHPHPVLKQKATQVSKIDAEIRKLLDDMLETMYAAAGVGLAAPQVGVLKRVVVIDISHEDEGEKRAPLYLVNPEIIWHSDEEKCQFEGCLSLPDQSAEVSRFKQVRVRYQDYDGKEREILAEGLLSVALQHEIDHLDGILYIDHISRLKRQMLLKKLQKMRQEESGAEE